MTKLHASQSIIWWKNPMIFGYVTLNNLVIGHPSEKVSHLLLT